VNLESNLGAQTGCPGKQGGMWKTVRSEIERFLSNMVGRDLAEIPEKNKETSQIKRYFP
jgi:hypothetical protein